MKRCGGDNQRWVACDRCSYHLLQGLVLGQQQIHRHHPVGVNHSDKSSVRVQWELFYAARARTASASGIMVCCVVLRCVLQRSRSAGQPTLWQHPARAWKLGITWVSAACQCHIDVLVPFCKHWHCAVILCVDRVIGHIIDAHTRRGCVCSSSFLSPSVRGVMRCLPVCSAEDCG
jgi:hypothetical protein